MKIYNLHVDPSHAWLQVPLSELDGFRDQISKYSYFDSNYAYLEEDCDLGTFLQHKNIKLNIYNTREIYHERGWSGKSSLTRFNQLRMKGLN